MRNNGAVKERSLVAFTLLAQLCIGAFWALGLLYAWVAGAASVETAQGLTSSGFLALIPLLVLALLASLLHLGTPQNAWRVAANLRSSWLSREIVFALLFTILEAVYALLQWQQIGPGWLRLLLWLSTAVTGGLLLYSMTRLYMLRTIPTWNTWMTPASFTITTLLMGSLAAGVLLALDPSAQGDLMRLPLVWIGLGAVFLLGFRAVLTALYAGGQETGLVVVQTSLLAFALSICSMLLYQSAVFELSGRSAAINWLIILSFLAALAEETLSRWLFYLRFERAGI
jgi:DMSO reductase anchor subunit